jgi:hypothetical protein
MFTKAICNWICTPVYDYACSHIQDLLVVINTNLSVPDSAPLASGNVCTPASATEFSSPCICESIFWHPTFVDISPFPQELVPRVAWFFLYAKAFSAVPIDKTTVASNFIPTADTIVRNVVVRYTYFCCNAAFTFTLTG